MTIWTMISNTFWIGCSGLAPKYAGGKSCENDLDKCYICLRPVRNCHSPGIFVTINLVVQAPVELTPGLHCPALNTIPHQELCKPSEDPTP